MREERLKAEISFNEKVFVVVVALISALIGWFVSNVDKAESYFLSGAGFSIAFLVAYNVYVWLYISRLLEELEQC